MLPGQVRQSMSQLRDTNPGDNTAAFAREITYSRGRKCPIVSFTLVRISRLSGPGLNESIITCERISQIYPEFPNR